MNTQVEPVSASLNEIRVSEPFPEHALPRVWVWANELRDRVADDFAPKDLDTFMELWFERMAAGARSWAVSKGNEIGGVIIVEPQTPIVATTHCIFKRTFWGTATTLPALAHVYREVFEKYHKILSFCFADNSQILGLARKLGAEKEGVLREQNLRNGKFVDMMAIGLLKQDFEAKMAEMTPEVKA